jgi:hypothetical protein
MSAWHLSVLVALMLVAASGLYVHFRWKRSPQARRAMVGLAVIYFLSGTITGAWIVHLSAGQAGEAQPASGPSLGSTATPAPLASALKETSTGPTYGASPLQYDPAHAVLPDAKLTPGDTLPAVTTADVCTPGWASEHRHVTESMRDEVYAGYGRTEGADCCEVDHLIPLELGGSNNMRNLWPQPDDPRPGWEEKDQLENALHSQVCAGKMALSEAQHCIASNWIQCWEKYVVPGYGPEWAALNRRGW